MDFIHELIEDGVLNVEYVPIDEQITYIFTRSFALPSFLQLRHMFRVKEFFLGGHLESSFLYLFM